MRDWFAAELRADDGLNGDSAAIRALVVPAHVEALVN